MSRNTLSLLFVSLLCVSCNETAIEQLRSLVGAKELPSSKLLARETISIKRGGGPYGGDALFYELRPDNSLTVKHTSSDIRNMREGVKGKEVLRISPNVGDQVRQLLWRVRPAKFDGVENYASLPSGCERKGPHDFGEVAIAFLDEADARRTEGRDVGIFELPYPQSCNTPAAVEARQVVGSALQLLPRSEVAVEYERST